MKKEIITGKSVCITVKGANEKDIDAALKKSFEVVLSELKKGRSYRLRPKKIGKTKLFWELEEEAVHV